jgi:hypothetical protein
MKVNGRRVAWIAALALAAMLAATPREGAAGPYKMIDQPHGPMLGDPDGPDPGSRVFIAIRFEGIIPVVVLIRVPETHTSNPVRRGSVSNPKGRHQ